MFSVHGFPLANLGDMSIKILMIKNYNSFKTIYASMIFKEERKEEKGKQNKGESFSLQKNVAGICRGRTRKSTFIPRSVSRETHQWLLKSLSGKLFGNRIITLEVPPYLTVHYNGEICWLPS